MKKVINWTFGSMFRTFGRFIAFTLLGCLLGIILNKLNISISDLFGLDIVKADTLPYSQAFYNVRQVTTDCYNHMGPMSECIFPSGIWDTDNNLGTSISIGGSNNRIQKIEFVIKDSGDYSAGFYQIQYNWGIDPRNSQQNQLLKGYNYFVYLSRNGGLEELADDYYCSMQLGSGNYSLDLTCTFTYSKLFDQLKVRLEYKCGDGWDNYCNVPGAQNVPEIAQAMSWNTIDKFELVSDSTSAINNQTTIIQNNFNETNQNINNINDSINSDDVSESSDEYSDFFSDFSSNTHGLTGIITAPLNAIQSLSSKSCSPLVLPLPFVNQNLTLPCMRSIYDQYFGNFMIIYDIITLGIVSYWVCVRIFALVKDFKNPDHDEVEVLDL